MSTKYLRILFHNGKKLKWSLIFLYLISFQKLALSQNDLCEACTAALINDPRNPENKYISLANSDPTGTDRVDLLKAQWLHLKLNLKYCLKYCGTEGLADYQKMILETEASIKNLASGAPSFTLNNTTSTTSMEQGSELPYSDLNNYQFNWSPSNNAGNINMGSTNSSDNQAYNNNGNSGQRNSNSIVINETSNSEDNSKNESINKKLDIKESTFDDKINSINKNHQKDPEQVRMEILAKREKIGNERRLAYQESLEQKLKSMKPNTGDCLLSFSFNSNVPLKQSFTSEKCIYSIGKYMPWSEPTVIPGTNIEFQYSLLYYCNIPPLTLADKMSSVMNDYAFVRIINTNPFYVIGKLEFDYIDQDGKTRTGQEGFGIDPRKKEDDLGMWYLACRFTNIRLLELKCKN